MDKNQILRGEEEICEMISNGLNGNLSNEKSEAKTKLIELVVNNLTETQEGNSMMVDFIGCKTRRDNGKFFVCPEENCGKGFSTRGNLKTHYSSFHEEKKSFPCLVNECNKSYVNKCRLEVHLRVHTGEKPFLCDHCDKAFNEKGNLKTHLRIHTGEKPFKCNYGGCSASFKAHGHLLDHYKSHFKIKPFKCTLCENSYPRANSLKIHMRTHFDEKAHKCFVESCSRSFKEKGNLMTHLDKIHKIKKANRKANVVISSTSLNLNLVEEDICSQTSIKIEPPKILEIKEESTQISPIKIGVDLAFNKIGKNDSFQILSNNLFDKLITRTVKSTSTSFTNTFCLNPNNLVNNETKSNSSNENKNNTLEEHSSNVQFLNSDLDEYDFIINNKANYLSDDNYSYLNDNNNHHLFIGSNN